MGAKNLLTSRLSQSALKFSLATLSAGVFVSPVYASGTGDASVLAPADAGPMGPPTPLPPLPPSGTGIIAGPGGNGTLKTAQTPSSVISVSQSTDAKPTDAKPTPVPAPTPPKPPVGLVGRPYVVMPPPHPDGHSMGLHKTMNPLAGIPSSSNAISALQKAKLSRLASLLGDAELATGIQNSKALSNDQIQALKTLATARFMSIAAIDTGGLAKLVTTLSKTESLNEAMRAPKLAFAGSSKAVLGTLAVLVLAAGPTVTFAEDDGELRLVLSDTEGQEVDDILISRD